MTISVVGGCLEDVVALEAVNAHSVAVLIVDAGL